MRSANFSPPRQAGTGQRAVDQTQAALKRLEPGKGDIHGGKLIQGVEVGTTAVLVAHGLGRSPTGWTVSAPSTAGLDVIEDDSPDRTKFLSLVAAGPGTVNVYVW